MICDFTTNAIAEGPEAGKHRHECRRCGVVRTTAGPKLVRECKGQEGMRD